MSAFNRIQNIQLSGIKTLILMIAFLPLLITPSMTFPYVTGKNFAFRILVELAAALWISFIVTKKDFRPNSSPLVLSILFFTFIVGLADLSGVNPYNSFWSNYERMEGYITILHLVAYYLILSSTFRTRKDWIIFFNVMIFVSLVVSLLAFTMQMEMTPANMSRFVMEYGKRAFSTIGNPPFLASYLLLSIFPGLILISNSSRIFSKYKYMYMLIIALHLVVIYITGSRAAILSAIVGIILFGMWFYLRKSVRHRGRKNKKIAFFILILMLIAGFFLKLSTESIENNGTLSRFANMLSDPSVTSRFDAWEMSWNGFKERPVFGWGQENFIGIYSVNPIPFSTWQKWTDRAHNIVIHWLINAGFAGLLAYLLIFAAAFYCIKRARNEGQIQSFEKITIIIALIIYFIQNNFTFDTINTYLIFFTLLAFIEKMNSVKNCKQQSASNSERNIGKLYVGLVSVISLSMFFIIFYHINYKPIKQNQLITKFIDDSSEYNSFLDPLDDFNNVLSLNTFGDSYVRQKMASVTLHILTRELLHEKGAVNFVEVTINELSNEISSNAYNLEYLTSLIRLYNFVVKYKPEFASKTKKLIQWCINKNPQYEWLYFALAETYRNSKDYEKSFDIVNKMVARDPKDDSKQFELALSAVLAGKQDISYQALENVRRIRSEKKFNNNVAGMEPVIRMSELYSVAEAYIEIKDFQNAIHYLKQITGIYPNHKVVAKYNFALAKVYFISGDKVNALKEAEKAATLDPINFREKADLLIGLIN